MYTASQQLVIDFIKAFSAGDADAAAACLSKDAVTHAKGFGKLSGPRHYDLILATTGAFKDLIPTGLQPHFLTVTGDGDRIAVEFEGNATLANGEGYCNQYCMVFTLKDGLIRSVNEYYCTILADAKIMPLLVDAEARRQA